MVLLIIIPFLNGYFIGNISHFQTYPNWSETNKDQPSGPSGFVFLKPVLGMPGATQTSLAVRNVENDHQHFCFLAVSAKEAVEKHGSKKSQNSKPELKSKSTLPKGTPPDNNNTRGFVKSILYDMGLSENSVYSQL